MQYEDYKKAVDAALANGEITSIEREALLKKAVATKTNTTLDNGLEHRVGAELHDWEYNDTINKDDLVTNIRHCIDSLYTTCIANQKADCNIKRVGGYMRDFKQNLNANAYYGLSFTARVLKYPLNNVWFFTEKFVHRLNRLSHSIYCKPGKTINIHDSGVSNSNVNGINTVTAVKRDDGNLSTNVIGTMKADTKHRKFFSNNDIRAGVGSYSKRKRTRPVTNNGKPDYDSNGYKSETYEDKTIIHFTIDDTPNRPDVFKHRLLMFIDGRLFNDLMMYTDGKSLILVLDPDRAGLTLNQLSEYCDENKNYKWSLIGIPFTTTKQSTGSVNPFNISTKNGVKYVDGIYPGKLSSASSYIVNDNFWLYAAASRMVKATNSDNKVYYDNKGIMDFGFVSNISYNSSNISYNSSDTMFNTNFSPTTSKILASQPNVSVTMVNIPNVIAYMNIGTNRIFQYGCTNQRPNPIPPENMLIFKHDSDGNLRIVHEYKITQYFPNVYKIENVVHETDGTVTYVSDEISSTDNLYVLVFYGKNDKTKFVNPIESYMTYKRNSYANDIISGEVPDPIKEYLPLTNEYTEVNYLDYHSMATRQIEHEYKLETLREMVHDDYSRLNDIYERHLIKTNQKLHSYPRSYYTYNDIMGENPTDTIFVDSESWEDETTITTVSRTRNGCFYTAIQFKKDEPNAIGQLVDQYLLFTVQHPDERSFDAAAWLDGVRLENITCTTKNFQTTIKISVLNTGFNEKSKLMIELFKVCMQKPTSLELVMPPKHNSMLLPRDVYDAVSPQNMMVCVKRQRPGPNGEAIDVWQVASNYEMYWLIIGNTQYIDGVPVNHDKHPYASSIRTDVVLENNGIALLQDDNVAVIANKENRYYGDYDLLVERGNEHYIYMTDKDEFDVVSRDIVLMQNLGYYGLDRRRFFYYMPYGKKDPDIFVTPITDYFANERVLIQNTDVHFTKPFAIKFNGSGDTLTSFAYPNFKLDPNPEKIRIFMDGKILDYYYDYVIQDIGTGMDLNDPSASSINLDNGWDLGSNLKFKILKPFKLGTPHSILFEYLPYKYRLIYRAIETDGIITFKDNINRPYNYKFFDIYLDGKLLMEDEIEIVSERVILIKPMKNETKMKYHCVSIYEKAHDEDVINYVWRPGIGHVHDKSVFESMSFANSSALNHDNCTTVDARYKEPNNLSIIDQLMMTDADFKKFMIPSWDKVRSKAESDYLLGIGSRNGADAYREQLIEEIENT